VSVVYHLLDEQEAFSEKDGGAISRWAANVLRDGSEVVICPSTDSSWGFPQDRVCVLPNWARTGPIHPVLYRLPWFVQQRLYRRILRSLLDRCQTGDTIYVHNRPECASALATVAGGRAIRIILHMHNSHLIRASRGQRRALRHVPVIFCSQFLRSEALAALPEHRGETYVVYNGADGCKFHRVEPPKFTIPTIVFTGRLVPQKGVHILKEAMRILDRRGVAANCKVVGTAGFGRERSTRYTRSLRRHSPPNIDFLGYHVGGQLAALLANADIFCCPSVWNDPFPLAPLEAMATGLPVVASRVGGLPEALAHGGGVLVPPNDAVALAEALECLVRDAELRLRLGSAARVAFLDHFRWSNVRSQYELALTSII
jgi:glycosyltransferase involved in cell wall biosynthesis